MQVVNNKESILVVDDDDKNLDLVVNLISEDNKAVTVVKAKDGAEALRKINNQKFNLIITDLRMPMLDGIGLIRALKDIPKDKQPDAILILSAYLNKDQKYGDGSRITYMAKPFDIPTFQNYLSTVLRNSSSPSRE